MWALLGSLAFRSHGPTLETEGQQLSRSGPTLCGSEVNVYERVGVRSCRRFYRSGCGVVGPPDNAVTVTLMRLNAESFAKWVFWLLLGVLVWAAWKLSDWYRAW